MPYPFKNPLIKVVLVFFLTIGLTPCLLLHAQSKKQGLRSLPEGQMRLWFLNHTGNFRHQDSVLILFDRTDRSGSGSVINSAILTMSNNHCVVIPRISSGRYFISVQCMGKHHDYWETTTWVRPKKCRILKIKLETCEESTFHRLCSGQNKM